MRENTVTRKIHFYRLHVFYPDSGAEAEWENIVHMFERIGRLPYSREGRYVQRYDGNDLSMLVDQAGPSIRGKIATRRLTGLPVVESGGHESPLVLDEDSCLFEPSHFIVFPNSVLGMEYNFYGPRATSLRNYIPRVLRDTFLVEVELLLRGDVLETLRRTGELTLLHVAIHRDGIERMEQLDSSLASAFETVEKVGGRVERLEIIMRRDTHSKEFIRPRFIDRVAQWLGRDENRDITHTFKIRAINNETGKIDDFDLLEDKLIGKRDIPKLETEHRQVDPQSMYQAIEETYSELSHEIQTALR